MTFLRKKIQNLAYGRFQYEKPTLQFSQERLELEVLQGEAYEGSFLVKSGNHLPLRGFVCASNMRMECPAPKFEGMEASIPFRFHSEGLVEGDVQRGDFTVVCDGGEYSLSFVASVTKFYAVSSIGRIRNLFDFANLAQASFAEAYRIFTAPFFVNILKEDRDRLLYRAVGGEHATPQGLEEFLIGNRKKQRVHVTLSDTERHLEEVTEDYRDSIGIERDRWGYLEMSVRSDSPAIVPEKGRITSDDFVGNHAELSYIVRAEQLHAGRNYARLSIRWPGQIATCDICVHVEGDSWDVHRKEKKEMVVRLSKLYLDYRLQRMVTGSWAKETCACLERLRELGAYDKWCMLYHAQALLANKQRQEAEWILDAFRQSMPGKKEPLYAYYLYLCTLDEREPSYVARVFRQIQQVYLEHQDDDRLFLIMLFLDPGLNQNRARKLAAIAHRASLGGHSPFLYLEALSIVRSDVYLLAHAGVFERKLLCWAAKHDCMTRELAGQAQRLLGQVRLYHPMWHKVLLACYEAQPEEEMLKSVCACLIKWNMRSREAAVWYERGIRADLKLAGLYEAWIESVGDTLPEEIPRPVLLYFQYQSNLPDKRKAQLYASIVRRKDSQKGMYYSYEKQIHDFLLEQLKKGQIDDSLAMLYESELQELVVDEPMAKALGKVLYTHRYNCPGTQARRIVVVHQELDGEQAEPIVRGQAFLRLYTGNYCIMAEDENGARYVPEESWELEMLMRPSHYLRACIQTAGEELPHLLHYFDGRRLYQTFQEEDMPRLRFLLDAPEVSSAYKEEIQTQVIEYCYNSYTGDELDEYLGQVECEGLSRNVRNRLLELMIARGIYGKAYEMVVSYGNEQASVSKLMLVAGQRILELDYAEDERLVRLCWDIFRRGKYNEQILRYLCLYSQGGIRQLEELWMAAQEFGLETFSLSERFLAQLLFTEGYTEHMEQIFLAYFDGQGHEMLVMACLSYFSYQYFVRQVVVPDVVFGCLERQLALGNPLNDSCRLAYFRWLAELASRTPRQEEMLEGLLSEYLCRNKYFAFYQQLPHRLLRKYQLYDRIILEYRTDPKSRVVVDYSDGAAGSEFLEEDMEQMYEGIFAKVFIVFFGEEIPYYIKEERENRQMITESGHIKVNEMAPHGDESSFDMINGMMVGYHLNDRATLRELRGQYEWKTRQVQELFRPL